ncbi:hypothetical protein [Desulfitibacter alkalitolerans]|uniref:hypothetical protein n=1 Tax=Desulfitibacter alkalitolerans TaxID=264641 RepID=UPI000480355B|nr:hypothetical protein [Desulfitibacter alkalitolerans]
MSIPDKELEHLVKQLNKNNKVVAKSFLSWLLEKQLDEDDNTLSMEEIEAIKKAREDYKNRETIPLEELKSELQL